MTSLTPGRVELESRLHELTESLIQKQTTLETLNSEKSTLNVQLQRLQVKNFLISFYFFSVFTDYSALCRESWRKLTGQRSRLLTLQFRSMLWNRTVKVSLLLFVILCMGFLKLVS